MNALDVLRTELLADPREAEKAWEVLVAVSLGFCRGRTGADRAGLTSELRARGVAVRPAPSFGPDIERLARLTESQLAILSSYASIRLGSTRLHADRACARALLDAADGGNVVVVGEPGAGKSAVLHDFVAAARAQHRDVVLMCADQLDARSLPLLRNELGLEHELVDVLANWPGLDRGFLVIDALDAARAEVTARTLRNLVSAVQQLNSRWIVVASIRKFDLRYSQELGRLFAGEPPSGCFVDNDFPRIRHLNIPQLTDEELTLLLAGSPELRDLVLRTVEPLRSLAKTPFYLFLLAQLLDAGLTSAELSATRTALELLDRYWGFRVLRDDRRGSAREALLLRACDQMMESQRLFFDRMAVAPGPEGDALIDDLLSTNLLAERRVAPDSAVDRYAVTFAHHIFYDYSIARLSFRGGAEALEAHLRRDPSLALTVRPSIQFVFQRLWLADSRRATFWSSVFTLCGGETPVLARLVGCTVAAREAKDIAEMNPLLSALHATASPDNAAAQDALRHVVAVIVDDSEVAQGHVWPCFAQLLSESLQPAPAHALRVLLNVLTDGRVALEESKKGALAHAARNLLRHALAQQQRDVPLVQQAIRVTARTLPWSPAENATALSAILSQDHVGQFGYQDLFPLACELKPVLGCAPEFVRDVYLAAFGYHESSREETSLGDSQILSLRSHKAQDFGSALYQLSTLYPSFLETSPLLASHVLASTLNEYVRLAHRVSEGEQFLHFEVLGIRVECLRDYSAIWDAGDTYRHDDAVKLLNAWDKYARQLADANSRRLEDVIRVVAERSAPTVVWRRLLLMAVKYPLAVGALLASLLESQDVLAGFDTSAAAGEMLKTAFATFSEAQRLQVERAILAIRSPSHEKEEYANTIRVRLLNCIPRALLADSQSREALAQAERRGPLPANALPSGPKVSSRPYGEEEYLAEQGVPVDDPVNAEMRLLEDPVEAFAAQHLNSSPSSEELPAALDALRHLRESLSSAADRGVHPAQIEYGRSVLARGAAAAAKQPTLSETGAGDVLKELLLEASASASPAAGEGEVVFDSPSWGSAPRIEGAAGLMEIAGFRELIDGDVIAAIRRLAADPVPAVRFQVAVRLATLRQVDEGLFWSLLTDYCDGEPTQGVLTGVLRGGLAPVLRLDGERAVAAVRRLFERADRDIKLGDVAGEAAELLAEAHVFGNSPLAAAFVRELVAASSGRADVVTTVCTHLREALVVGDPAAPDERLDGARVRAVALVTQAAQGASAILTSWRRGEASYQDDTLSRVARLIDCVATQIYFAAGGGGHSEGSAPSEPSRQAQRLLLESRDALLAVAEAGIPSATHYLVQTLELFVETDPPGVFRLLARSVVKGRDGRYEYESLGVDVVVRILERYLADHRDLFRTDPECRAELIRILDIFVGVGWPSARRLAHSLEDMFR